MAPWNLHLYSYRGRHKGIIWFEYQGLPFPLIFYHFEGLKYLSKTKTYLNIWQPSERGMGRKTRMLYGEYLKSIVAVQELLDERYGVKFEHMIASRKAYAGKRYSLKQFCKEDGLIDGAEKWAGYWTNNIRHMR